MRGREAENDKEAGTDVTKVVMLLDIDGVLNAVSPSIPTQYWKKSEWRTGELFGYPLKWAVPVVDWLNTLHERGDVEIRWHTTWQEDAHVFADLVGLPRFEVQACPEWERFNANGAELAADLIRACQPPWWKYPAAERVVAEEKRPLVWIDDDIYHEIPRRTRVALRSVRKLCLVNPDRSMGLPPKHMRMVDAFVDEMTAPRGALSAS